MNESGEPEREFQILLVEDNPADIILAKEVFGEASTPATIHDVTNGPAALNFLRKNAAFADARTPDLILLDLNMPGMDGRRVLEEIKGDPELRRVPVVVLTSSQSEEDRRTAYDLHANAFMLKPSTLDGALELAEAILSYWAKMVALPPK